MRFTLVISSLYILLATASMAAEPAVVRQYGLGKVTLTGSDFGEEKGRATLGGARMRIESWGPAEIVLRVPSTIAAGNHKLVITAASGERVTEEDFFVNPNVWSIAARVEDGATMIELTGSNLGQEKGKLRLEIPGAEHVAAEWTNERILVQVADAAPAGWYRAYLFVDGRRFETGQFAIAPRADRLVPDGEAYAIEGGHLATGTEVTIHGVPAEVYARSPKKLWFKPALHTGAGRNEVRVTAARTQSEPLYLAIEPQIRGLQFLKQGMVVLGDGFGVEANGDFYFNGHPLPIYAWDNTSVTVGFPKEIGPGEHKIVARIGGIESPPHFLRIRPGAPSRIIDGKWETPDFQENW